jgi:3-deoxy-D-manno-octulosonate 8-phosphate phosphatase (KDO 8-P phosphatase)
LSAMRAVGLAVAVADACVEVREAAQFVTTLGGGQGAVRETIEMILKSQRRWNDLIQRFTS